LPTPGKKSCGAHVDTSIIQDPDPLEDDIRDWTGMTMVECIRTVDRVEWKAVMSPFMASDLQQRGQRVKTVEQKFAFGIF